MICRFARGSALSRISAISLAVSLLLSACVEEQKINVAASLDPMKMATMTTRNVSTLISDSGVIQYKIVAPVWKVYDEATPRTGFFRKGYIYRNTIPISMWWRRSLPTRRATFRDRRLWRLEGNVEMTKSSTRSVPFGKALLGPASGTHLQRHLYSYRDSNPMCWRESVSNRTNGSLRYRVLKPQGIFPVPEDDAAKPTHIINDRINDRDCRL